MHSEEKVAVGVAALYVANIATLAFNTLFLVLLTNALRTTAEVGLVSLLNLVVVGAATLSVLALPVTGAGVAATPPAVTRFLSEYIRDGLSSARRVYFASLAICGAVSMTVFLVLAYWPVPAFLAGPADGPVAFFAGVDAVVFSFGQLGAYAMLGAGKATGAGKAIVVSSVARYAIASAFLFSGSGPSGVFIGFAIGDSLLAVLTNASAAGAVQHLVKPGPSMRPVRNYMASVFFAAVMGLAVSQTDKLLAFFQQGLGNLAVYNVATVGAAVASFAPSAATNVLVPALSSYSDRDRKKEMLRRYTRYISLTAIPTGFALAAVSPFLLRIFGEAYVSGWPLLSVVAISISFSSIASVYSASLLVDDRAHHFTLSTLAALAVLVLVSLTTVPVVGLLGIAIARGAMLLSMTAAVAFFVHRSGMLVLDSLAYLKSLGASAAMALLVFLALSVGQREGLSSRGATVASAVVMLPAGLLVYLLIMKALKGFNQTDMDFVDTLLPRSMRFVSRLARKLL
ncbi:MAG: polysaccharide biosynthesis C-terminal domain-containing protein [archaeon]|nr:MAG: polysaccharide biosynthesis C-terminal domain-containing protein [archaeon]